MKNMICIKKKILVFVLASVMMLAFQLFVTEVSAAQELHFNSTGVLTVHADGTFSASGANVSSGTLEDDTTIRATEDLDVVLNNMNPVTISSIEADANVKIGGMGELVVHNTNGTGITIGGNLEINSNLRVTGSLHGIYAPTTGSIILNNAVVNTFGAGHYGLHTTNGDITVNDGQLYSGGRVNSVSSFYGNISVLGSNALIESTSKNAQTVRTEWGDILIDGGKIYVPESRVDAISTGRNSTKLTVKNGGIAEGFGENSGVSGGSVFVDNAKIIGTSNRIGASCDLKMVVQNGGVVTGTVFDATEQSFGVVSWEGELVTQTDGTIQGTAEIGVLGFSGSIRASGGRITGYGEQYGVEAVGNITAENGGIITGNSTNQVATARGVGARTNMTLDNGTIIGSSYYRGVFANGTLDVENNSLVQGNADFRVDGHAAVLASSITVHNNGTIQEVYAADTIAITDEQINPYFGSTNMNSFINFEWTTISGKVEKGETGIYATAKCDGGTILTAERLYKPGVDEVVKLTATGTNKHIIQLPVVLEPKADPVDPKPSLPKPVDPVPGNPTKPESKVPQQLEKVIISTRFGPNTVDDIDFSVYEYALISTFLLVTYLHTKKKLHN